MCNITDAGHLEGDRDEGDDNFVKRAKLEQLEPMEIVQKYTIGFHDVMREFRLCCEVSNLQQQVTSLSRLK